MISKELLSEVLGKSLRNFNFYIDNNKLVYDRLFYEGCEDGHDDIINIYELAHKCKEWAHKEGWWVDSNLNFVSIGKLNQSVSWKTFNGYDLKMKEADLIYHSCQWILDKETK